MSLGLCLQGVDELTQVLRERYVRDDIPCGFESCHLCSSFPGFKPILPDVGYTNHSKFNDKSGFYLVVDTNVVLHQVSIIIDNPLP